MTEIPEHLLKRSKQRREAMGLSGGDAGEGASGAPPDAAAEGSDVGAVEQPPAAAAAASAPAPPPAAPAAPPPKPDPPYITAARTRKRVPIWATPVLALLPLWGLIYYHSLQKPPAGADDPLVLGAEVYNVKGGCAGCHGADGAGGVGAKLNDGDTVKTFKNPLAMVHWLAYGAADGARSNGTYGDLNRPDGPRNVNALPGQMPAFKDTLTPEELAAVTMYVREEIAGAEPEKGFSAEDFPNLADTVQEVIDLGPGGDPKVPGGSGGATQESTGGAPPNPTNASGGASAGGDAGTDQGDATSSAGNSTGAPGPAGGPSTTAAPTTTPTTAPPSTAPAPAP